MASKGFITVFAKPTTKFPAFLLKPSFFPKKYRASRGKDLQGRNNVSGVDFLLITAKKIAD
jgi:hypothetical protein